LRFIITSASADPGRWLLLNLVLIVALCWWPFNFWQQNRATIVSGDGLKLAPPSNAFTASAPAKVGSLRDFTVLLDITPGPPGENERGRILTYGWDKWVQNLVIEQEGVAFVCSRGAGGPRVHAPFTFRSDRRLWLAAVVDSSLSLFVDGLMVGSVRLAEEQNVNTRAPLILGSEGNGKSCWTGLIHTLVILPRALTAADLTRPMVALLGTQPVLLYNFTKAGSNTIDDEGMYPPSPLVITQHYQMPKREVLLSPFLYWSGTRLHLRDFFMNLLLLSPLGFLLRAELMRRALSPAMVPAAVVVISTALSLGMELGQAFLPSRYSSGMDVITNTIGAFAGSWVHLIYERTKERELNFTKMSFLG
jgi:hypothetical protein